jgi:hypothetical protein
MLLLLDIEGETFPLRCQPERAPNTLARLLASLPQRVDLHCPKIAGSHIYWGAPFVVDVEAAQDVMRMPDGAFFFWPERQMLEVAYAPLQSETASVTLLGRCEGDLAALRRIGERVASRQGAYPVFATLRAAEPYAVPAQPVPPTGLAALRARRQALWSECPAEIAALLASRAIMHPAGPLFFAESDARGLHEALWWQYRQFRTDRAPAWRDAAALAVAKAAARLGDFCHLTEAAATLDLARRAFLDPLLEADAVFEEAIVVAGRLANWLDLQMPWHAINEAVRASLDAAA